MSFFAGALSGYKRNTTLYSDLRFENTRYENAFLNTADQIIQKVFDGKEKFTISLTSRHSSSGSELYIGFHPLFSLDPSEFPDNLSGKAVTANKIKSWIVEYFSKGWSTLLVDRQSLEKTVKMFKWLMKHQEHYKGVQRFIIAQEAAKLLHNETTWWSGDSCFYQQIAPRRVGNILPANPLKVLPFIWIASGLYAGSLFALAIGVAGLALVIFLNRRAGSREKKILLTAVKATGNVESAKLYFRLVKRLNPRRFDWVRRKIFDPLMQIHDPLKTLSKIKVVKKKKDDSFSSPLFGKK